MLALVDSNASEELILTIRDYIRPNLMGHSYESRDNVIDLYKNEKYSWIDKSK